MRTTITRGNFSHDGKSKMSGLIALCHVCKQDTEKSLATMANKINSYRKKREWIVIAPFVGLYPKNESAPFEKAQNLFIFLSSKIKNSTLLPLRYPEIHLHVVQKDGFLDFLES